MDLLRTLGPHRPAFLALLLGLLTGEALSVPCGERGSVDFTLVLLPGRENILARADTFPVDVTLPCTADGASCSLSELATDTEVSTTSWTESKTVGDTGSVDGAGVSMGSVLVDCAATTLAFTTCSLGSSTAAG